MSIAFNASYPVLDGNVERVFARLFNVDRPVKERSTRTLLWKTAKELIPEGNARCFNQSLMELGATICLPKRPDCDRCPVVTFCESHKLGLNDKRPVVTPGKRTTAIHVVVGIFPAANRKLINLLKFPSIS
ncbi:MAG: hypothetical protein NTX88_11205 [Candidatus Atribacteria bacterium]|nr:hypothetical protein [Candidatus Atribacteria bacterium]